MSFKGKSIVIGTDLSPASFHALEVGLSWAKTLGLKAEIVHSYEDPYKMVLSAYDMGQIGLSADQLAQLKEGAFQEIKRQVKKCRLVPADYDIKLLEGHPVDVLQQHCQKSKPALLAIGLRGHGMLEELFIGSVAKKLIRAAKFPVLAVHKDAPLLPKKALFASEALQPGSIGHQWSAELSRIIEDSLEIFHIVSPNNIEDDLKEKVESESSPLSIDEALAQSLKVAENKMKKMQEMESMSNTKTRCIVNKTVDTASLIGDKLEKGHFDLAILGSYGRKGLSRWLMGSTTEVLSERAICSMLVVR